MAAMPDDLVPKLAASLVPASDEPLLDAWNIRKYFPIRGGVLSSHIGDVKAVDGVSFSVRRGETVGLVGESGCGKTTAGRLILRLIEPTSGHTLLHLPKDVAQRVSDLYLELNAIKLAQAPSTGGQPSQDPRTQPILRELDQIAHKHSIYRMRGKALRDVRAKMQIVFQDPFSSLSPRMLVRDIVAEPMAIHHMGTRSERYKRVGEILQDVGLNPEHLWRFPHEFSGGQRQRIGIARALALEPEFIVLDEPTSALDVSVQAQVLNILLKLQREHNLAYLFISHHLSVVRAVSHRVVVMYLGEVVETAPTEELFARPLHPYTQALLSAIPIPDPSLKRTRILLKGDVPSPASPPSGCRFHTRCPMVMPICSKVSPGLLPYKNRKGHLVACHLYTGEGGAQPSTPRIPSVVPPRASAPAKVLTELPEPSGSLAAPSPPPDPAPARMAPVAPAPPPPPPPRLSPPPAERPLPSAPVAPPLPMAPSVEPPRAARTTVAWRSHPLLEGALSTDSTASPSLGRSLRDRYKRGS